MLILLPFSLLLFPSHRAVAAPPPALPLLTLLDKLPPNSTALPNGSLSHQLSAPIPKEPYRLTNLFVHPPIAVDFTGYGDPIPQAVADICLYEAIDDALNTRAHRALSPIHTADLDYTNAKVSLNFHPGGVVIWNEWKNALYLILKFVDGFDTREFLFTVEVSDGKHWCVVGRGYLITF